METRDVLVMRLWWVGTTLVPYGSLGHGAATVGSLWEQSWSENQVPLKQGIMVSPLKSDTFQFSFIISDHN